LKVRRDKSKGTRIHYNEEFDEVPIRIWLSDSFELTEPCSDLLSAPDNIWVIWVSPLAQQCPPYLRSSSKRIWEIETVDHWPRKQSASCEKTAAESMREGAWPLWLSFGDPDRQAAQLIRWSKMTGDLKTLGHVAKARGSES
jgi:hypothetical protein